LFQTLYWPFIVKMNCSSDLKSFANSCIQARIQFFFQSLKQFWHWSINVLLFFLNNNFIPFSAKVLAFNKMKMKFETSFFNNFFLYSTFFVFFRESFTKSPIKQHSVKIGRKNMWHYVMTDEWLIIPVWTITCLMFMVNIFTFYFYNFSCRFLNLNYLFPIWILTVLIKCIRYPKPPGTS
jgi:hypothetical protein